MYGTWMWTAAATLLLVAVGVRAGDTVCEQKLVASDGAPGEQFGIAVSISDDTAIVAANLDDDKGAASGSAYVFRWTGAIWEQEQKLLALEGAAHDAFGFSVSIQGDLAIVGAVGEEENSGSAYVFRWNGSIWSQEQKLIALDGAAGDSFGNSVSLSGDVAVVGALGDDENGEDSESVLVFRWNGSIWQQEQELLASGGAAYDLFGSSVTVDGNVLIVGALGLTTLRPTATATASLAFTTW